MKLTEREQELLDQSQIMFHKTISKMCIALILVMIACPLLGWYVLPWIFGD